VVMVVVVWQAKSRTDQTSVDKTRTKDESGTLMQTGKSELNIRYHLIMVPVLVPLLTHQQCHSRASGLSHFPPHPHLSKRAQPYQKYKKIL
jgi:hypothetical protein